MKVVIDHLPRRPLGNTTWHFHCSPHFEYDSVKGAPPGKTAIKITSVNMKLGLDIFETLPEKHTPKLREHEDGHVTISNRIYAKAQKVAQDSCAAVVGRTFTGSNENAAVEAAAIAVCDAYNKKVGLVCDSVNEVYDKITVHGLNELPTKKAIEKAFKTAPVP